MALDDSAKGVGEMAGWQPLEGVLGQRSSVRILRHLVTTGEENSGRGIATAPGMNPWTCHLSLRDLTAAGDARLARMVDRGRMLKGRSVKDLMGAERAGER